MRLDVVSLDASEQDKHNKSLSSRWQLWSLGPQRHFLFSYWGTQTEKTTHGRIQWGLSSGFVFCLVNALLLFMPSLRVVTFATRAIWTESLCFWKRRYLPLFGNTENVPGPPEVSWIINEDRNLRSNSKKKICLNNEWIGENDLIWILCVHAVCVWKWALKRSVMIWPEFRCLYSADIVLNNHIWHKWVVPDRTALKLKDVRLPWVYWDIDIYLYSSWSKHLHWDVYIPGYCENNNWPLVSACQFQGNCQDQKMDDKKC